MMNILKYSIAIYTKIHCQKILKQIIVERENHAMADSIESKIKSLNKQIRQIKSVYGTSATQLGKYADISSGILIPAGKKRSGEIRNIEEVNKFISQHFGPEYQLTQADYEQRLNRVLKLVGDRLTIEGEERYQRSRINSILDDIEKETGQRPNFDDLTVNEIKDIFREANNRMYKHYTNWYETVVEIFDERE